MSHLAICCCANVALSLTSKHSSVGGILWSSSTHVRLIRIKLSSEAKCIIGINQLEQRKNRKRRRGGAIDRWNRESEPIAIETHSEPNKCTPVKK